MPVEVEAPASLTSLAAQIADAHHVAQSAATTAVEQAKRAGELLIEAKDQLHKHGAWELWIVTNCSCSVQMAQRYMRIAREWPRIEAEINTSGTLLKSVKQALRILAKDDEPEDESTDDAGGSDNDFNNDPEQDFGDGGDNAPESQTRTVPLYFDLVTREEFLRLVHDLKPLLETTNTTDTVAKAVWQIHAQLIRREP